jgi:hypothetical protein
MPVLFALLAALCNAPDFTTQHLVDRGPVGEVEGVPWS